MDKGYRVSTMTEEEVAIAIKWAAREGWNPGIHDLRCFYKTDPQGFFVGKLNGKIIAIGSAVIYDSSFAFCGFYIVDPVYRAQGYGLELTKARLAYIGTRNAGLDGVLSMEKIYARLGYKTDYLTTRYCYEGHELSVVEKDPNIVFLKEIDFNLLTHYDRAHFPAPRAGFLKCWINQPEGASLGYLNKGKLVGYGVLRACFNGFKIGPLFADDDAIAEALFLHLVFYAKKKKVYIDCPENNPKAVILIKKYHLENVFQAARMYLRNKVTLPMEEIYGITSFELG